MGDISGGRVGIAILFLPSIICCPAERFTRGRAKGFGKVSWWGGFDRDVSFGEIFCLVHPLVLPILRSCCDCLHLGTFGRGPRWLGFDVASISG